MTKGIISAHHLTNTEEIRERTITIALTLFNQKDARGVVAANSAAIGIIRSSL